MKKTKKSETKTICKNCNYSFEGNFCNNCGQTAKTDRINFLLFKHDTDQGISRIDSGIIYSVSQLFKRPGHTIREYIEGKRVKHYKPVSLVIILATTYGILYHYSRIDLIGDSINIEALNGWTANHYSWITLATIPFYTIGSYICFRKQGYNISELLMLNFFKAAQRLSISILAFPFLWFYSKTSEKVAIANLIFLAGILFTVWTDIQFFNKLTKIRAAILSILSQLIFLAIIVLILMIVLSILNKPGF